MSKFVDVILPVPIGACFTYILRQEDENVKIGCRVIIPFGKKKIELLSLLERKRYTQASYGG